MTPSGEATGLQDYEDRAEPRKKPQREKRATFTDSMTSSTGRHNLAIDIALEN